MSSLYRYTQRQYYNWQLRLALMRYKDHQGNGDPKKIPIVINNRNRVTYMDRLIVSLKQRGYHNITILDNNSTYKPLLRYYSNTECKVIRLEKNYGHLALWNCKKLKHILSDYYVYTDSDLELVPECPSDFLEKLVSALRNYRKLHKVGLSLVIDDLPTCFSLRDKVVKWENALRGPSLSKTFYQANVDTTFALYRPYCTGGSHAWKQSARAEFPISARHLPWYNDSANLNEEERFYIANSETSTFWTKQNL